MALVGRAAGMPDYHGYFIPELWTPKLQYQFEKATVLMDIASTEYEGMIKNYGDTVHINVEPTVTIRDYVKGQELVSENLDPEKISLEINTAKYFRVLVDDVDQKQSMVNLIDEFATSAGRRMKEKVDQTVLQAIYADEHASNSGTTAGADSAAFDLGVSTDPVVLTADNIVEHITYLSTVLDEQSVPEDGRWLVLPPVFVNLLLNSDLKDASFTGDSQTVQINGKLNRSIAGFTMYVSRQLYSVADGTTTNTCWYCLAGHKSALTFASQYVYTRAIEAQNTFGHYIDGLNVFGYKVVRDEALAVLYAERG